MKTLFNIKIMQLVLSRIIVLTFSLCSFLRALADMNSDGRMDMHEFSIAMKLIKLKLQGHPLPPSLPPSMKQPPLPLPPQTGFGKTQTKTHNVLYMCENVLFFVYKIFPKYLPYIQF